MAKEIKSRVLDTTPKPNTNNGIDLSRDAGKDKTKDKSGCC